MTAKRRLQLRKADRIYRRKHPDRIRAKSKRYYRENREKILAYISQWARNNPEKCSAKVKAWRVRNPSKVRARKLSHKECDPASANALTQLIESVTKMKCAMCGKNMRRGDRTIDHVIPLSKGGSGHIGNLQVVHKRCNSQKKAKMPHELDGQMQIHLVGRVA